MVQIKMMKKSFRQVEPAFASFWRKKLCENMISNFEWCWSDLIQITSVWVEKVLGRMVAGRRWSSWTPRCCGEPVNILSSMEYNWSSQANMAGFLEPIGLNHSSQEGCQGYMTRGENQLDWNVFFIQLLSLLLSTLVKPGGPPREPLFHDLPCGT